MSVVVPQNSPSLMNFDDNGACYQVVLYFTATTAALQAWRDAGSPASRLFAHATSK